ncbi:WD40/YVTN/BNR-like repeat-containing protein [Maribacter sp.]|uniref:WD40/YVTN/BNR-like repeat-containing protein n=1 Tax=Maribacter sp. TaxID=1897614 RepID=UPI0025B87DD7|nr:exo-alpha-sialidase [Maribacter sp.]
MKIRFSILFFAFAMIAPFAIGQKIDFSTLKNLKIRNVGPANMSGRITAIDVVTDHPKTMFVGAASGGVWKSENGGSAWKPVFDEQPTQNIGALAIQQNDPNVIWVGTGEGNPRNSMNLGMGVFKSTDGGKTWKHMGLKDTKTIHRIRIDPNDPNIVYVGAMGDPFTENEHRGLYKTVDGGLHWEKILYSNTTSGIADLVMHPTNSKKLFAALYQHKRTPYYFTSGGEGSGFYVTDDAGAHWRKLDEKNGLPSGDLGRIGIAIAPSKPDRIYAKIEAKKNAIYRSDDGGASWEMINDNPKFANNRPFYFQDLAVDSEDPDRVYNIYQPLSVSYDGAATFDTVPMIPADETKGIHADFHAFWVNPKDAEHFIIGGDGGLGITQDHGKSWYFPETIPVAQFYHVGVDNDTPYNVYGGMQDNGNWSGPAYTWKRGGIRTLYWQYLVGGDGFDISPDPDNSRFGYGSSQNGDLYRYDKLTGYYVSIKPPSEDINVPLRFNWNAAFARDPKNDNAAYYGSQFVHVTKDKGATWKIISPDLTTNNPEHQKPDYGGLTLDVSGAERYNAILSIAPSSLNERIVWVGTDDGQVQLTTDGGKKWKNITSKVKGMPNEGWIAQIEASRYNENSAWMVVNNYRKGDYEPYVFKTDDLGKTWKRVADNTMVKGYALSIIQDPVEPNLVFLGTENGLWISIDEGATWSQFKNGFPSVSTMDLKIQEKESALIVGTFGRAIWVLDDLSALREIAANRLKLGLTALPMNDAVQVKGLFINPPGNIWTGFHTTFEGENKVFQKTKIPFYLTDEPTKETKVTAMIYDQKDRLINTVETKELTKGLNYMIWKLDETASSLPGSWTDDFSRDIPVLPGEYTIVLEQGTYADTTKVTVVADPRFEVLPSVDKALYDYKKEVDAQVEILSNDLKDIDAKSKKIADWLSKIQASNNDPDQVLVGKLEKMEQSLKELRAKGKTPKPDRQVGAWQSFDTTPYSKIKDALRIAAAQNNEPSVQHQEILGQAKKLVAEFSKTVSNFMDDYWVPFQENIEKGSTILKD